MNRVVTAPIIAREAVDLIRKHGRETYPHECCGALLGGVVDGYSVAEAVPLPNRTSEGPRRRFLIAPEDYLEAERRAARQDLELVGFYHSHPDHAARPSQYDLDHAWPNVLYVIVSVLDGEAIEVRCWRLDEDRTRFVETGLERASNGGLEGCL